MNKVILIGRLGADPEVRATKGGTSVASLRLATTERRKSANGDWENVSEWHSLTAWGKTAETIGQYTRKGDQLGIEGRLQTRKWQDKDGRDRYTTEVVIDGFDFGAKGNSGGGGERSARGGNGYSQERSSVQDDGPAFDDEVCF